MLEREWLICAFSSDPLRVPGTVDRDCSLCGRSVMVAPTGQVRLAQIAALVPVCPRCAAVTIAADPDPKFEPLRADQVGEILGFLRRN